MWAPSVGLATVAPGRRGDRAYLLAGRPARLFVVSSLRPCDTGERQRAGPAGRWLPGHGFLLPGLPAAEAAGGLAVLDLLDHAAAELAADQLHAGQALRPGGGWASVIRPLLVGEGARLRPWRRAGAGGFRLLPAPGERAAGIRRGAGGTAVVRRRGRPAGAAPGLGSGRRVRGGRTGGGRAGGR